MLYWWVTQLNFLRLPFEMCKNKILNKSCFHLPKSWFVGKRKINIKKMKKNLSLKPYDLTSFIWYDTDILIPDSMEMWETHVNLIFF